MNNKTLFSSSVLSSVFVLSAFFLFSFFQVAKASESNDFILTEDSFSSTENSASSSDIISESIILPIQYIGETNGEIIERSHELSICGNGIQEFQEICDGGDFNGKTCSDFGFNSGTLTCSSNCLALVTGACNNSGNGLLQTATPIPTSVPSVISSGGSSPSTGGSGSSGGKDPLLLITPIPTAIASFHPVATEQPRETTQGELVNLSASPSPPAPTLDPYLYYTNEYEGDLSSSSISKENESENLDIQKDENNLKKITPYEWLAIDNGEGNSNTVEDNNQNQNEEISPYDYADYTPLIGDLFGEKLSLIEMEKSVENIFESPDEKNLRLHSSSQYEKNNDLQWNFGCGKYYWVILLITFLLGMFTEYIISSVLLIQKK